VKKGVPSRLKAKEFSKEHNGDDLTISHYWPCATLWSLMRLAEIVNVCEHSSKNSGYIEHIFV